MGSVGIAYNDTEYKRTGEKNAKKWNKGWQYRNDGVDIGKDSLTGEYFVSSFEEGEWINYSVNVKKTKEYKVVPVSLAKKSSIIWNPRFS